MATSPATNPTTVPQNALVNYLISMARTVEVTVSAALDALLERNPRLASQVFLAEPGINEMEILIDEHAVRLLSRSGLAETDVRLVVATIKINKATMVSISDIPRFCKIFFSIFIVVEYSPKV